MSEASPEQDLSSLFVRMRAGDPEAVNAAYALLYSELHRLAARHMRSEGRQHTLQTTALVNEAYIRLMHGPDVINDRRHFFALAAQAMRRILVDHARHKSANKRGGDVERVTLELAGGTESVNVDMLALDIALEQLAALDPRAAKVVELRFFGGHTDLEVCDILGEKMSTIRSNWEFARSWLRTRLRS